MSEIKHWFLSCVQQDPVSSSAVYTAVITCMNFSSYSILKSIIFFFKFSFCVHFHLEKSHLHHVFVFIWGLIPVQRQILLNLQFIPGFIYGHPRFWIAMKNSLSSIPISKIFIHQWIEYCNKVFFILLCYNTMPCKTVSPIHPSNQRSWCKSDVQLGPSTGCDTHVFIARFGKSFYILYFIKIVSYVNNHLHTWFLTYFFFKIKFSVNFLSPNYQKKKELIYLAFINKIKMEGGGLKKLLFLKSTKKKARNKAILVLRFKWFSKEIYISLAFISVMKSINNSYCLTWCIVRFHLEFVCVVLK